MLFGQIRKWLMRFGQLTQAGVLLTVYLTCYIEIESLHYRIHSEILLDTRHRLSSFLQDNPDHFHDKKSRGENYYAGSAVRCYLCGAVRHNEHQLQPMVSLFPGKIYIKLPVRDFSSHISKFSPEQISRAPPVF